MHVDFSLRESCRLNFVLVKFLYWFTSSKNWFLHGASCVLIFVLETRCILIFLFVMLVYWFSSSYNWFCSLNSLSGTFSVVSFVCETFCKLIFSLCETSKLIFFFTKLILLMEPVLCWFLFAKLVAGWFFPSWNFNIDFSPHETDPDHCACCVLIFSQ